MSSSLGPFAPPAVVTQLPTRDEYFRLCEEHLRVLDAGQLCLKELCQKIDQQLTSVESLRTFSKELFSMLYAQFNADSSRFGGSGGPAATATPHSQSVSPLGGSLTPRWRLDRQFCFGEPANVSELVSPCDGPPIVTSTMGGGGGTLMGGMLSSGTARQKPSLVLEDTLAPLPDILSPSATTPTAVQQRARMIRAQRRLSSIFPNPNMLRSPTHTRGVTEVQTEDALKKINQYLLLEKIGAGAQGVVFLGYDEVTNEFRAIKEIRRPLPTSTAMERITNEIEIMRNMRHKNIVSLHEILDDPTHKKLYVVMQFVERGPLIRFFTSSRMFCETIPHVKFAFYARQLCAGLTYLHRQNILHHDIKPDNILLGNDDVVYLTDFGVSQVLLTREEEEEQQHQQQLIVSGGGGAIGTASSSTGTWSGTFGSVMSDDGKVTRQESGGSSNVLDSTAEENSCSSGLSPTHASGKQYASTRGTPAFFAPEMLDGTPEAESDGPNVDVWALGVSFFMFLYGRHPFLPVGRSGGSPTFSGITFDELRDNILHQPLSFPPPTNVARGVSPANSPLRVSATTGDSTASTPLCTPMSNSTDDSSPRPPRRLPIVVPSVPRAWEEIIQGMLEKDPKNRLTLPEVRSKVKDLNS